MKKVPLRNKNAELTMGEGTP